MEAAQHLQKEDREKEANGDSRTNEDTRDLLQGHADEGVDGGERGGDVGGEDGSEGEEGGESSDDEVGSDPGDSKPQTQIPQEDFRFVTVTLYGSKILLLSNAYV